MGGKVKIRRQAPTGSAPVALSWSLFAILCSTAAFNATMVVQRSDLSERPRFLFANWTAGSPSRNANEVAGTYLLQTAGGMDLPAIVAENETTGYRLEVTEGWTKLVADQTFAWSTTYRMTQQGSVGINTSQGKGTYSLNGGSLHLKSENSSDTLKGTLTGGTLTIEADVRLVYRKKEGA
jgi:hypothetical protein